MKSISKTLVVESGLLGVVMQEARAPDPVKEQGPSHYAAGQFAKSYKLSKSKTSEILLVDLLVSPINPFLSL